MTLSQKRQRRVELLIDQRLVGFLKPTMSVSSGPVRCVPQEQAKKPVLQADSSQKNRAS